MLQATITLKKRQGVEIGLDQIMGFTLRFFDGISTLSTDSGQEYRWCPASNRIGVTSCGVTQITKGKSWWQTSPSKIMQRTNSDANGALFMTSSNCATIKRPVSMMNSGDKTGFGARLKSFEYQSSAATGVFSHEKTTPSRSTRSDRITTAVRLM